MKVFKDLRSQTSSQQKYVGKNRRKLSNQIITTVGEQCPNFSATCFTPKSKETITKQYSSRNSGKILTTPIAIRHRNMPQIDYITNYIKPAIQKLQYREKLVLVQSFFRTARQLCKVYGYFYATFAMLQFDLEQQNIITLWIHPDIRSTRPLHPIKKQTQFQCEIQCVRELKNIIEFFLPDIDIGDGNTFSNIIAHIQITKADIDKKRRRQITQYIDNKKLEQSKHKNLLQNTLPDFQNTRKQSQKFKNIHIKTLPQPDQLKQQQEALQYENNRKMFKIETKNKQTKSTLIQSFKSVNSIKQKLKQQITNMPKSKEHYLNLQYMPKGQTQQSVQNSDQKLKLILGSNLTEIKQTNSEAEKTQHKSTTKLSYKEKQSYLRMKSSISGRKLMSMSIQMQSQINNLFGAQDVQMQALYVPNADRKALKNSMLSRVAQQFQDLF